MPVSSEPLVAGITCGGSFWVKNVTDSTLPRNDFPELLGPSRGGAASTLVTKASDFAAGTLDTGAKDFSFSLTGGTFSDFAAAISVFAGSFFVAVLLSVSSFAGAFSVRKVFEAATVA